jgi:dolichol-phosphate mannosyltransferase
MVDTPSHRDVAAYRAGLLQQAFTRYGDRFITERRFACMAEILIHLRPLAPRVCEVPMVLRYDRKLGRSKMRVGRTVFQTLRLLARARAKCLPEEPLR